MEDEEMIKIINENYKKQRVLNAQKAKKRKKEELITNVMLTIGAGIFFVGLLILVQVIENLQF